MKEDFLHYIWQNKLFKFKEYKADNDVCFEIIDVGIPNPDAGPDFFNAKVKSNGTVWSGNIEIHIKASDWQNHKHHLDKLYDNVILHVVETDNCRCFNSANTAIPTIKLDYPKRLLENYNNLQLNNSGIACEDRIHRVDPMLFAMWSENLAVERLETKTDHIQSLLKHTNNNWEESFYRVLARSFGFGVNSVPFELLAKSLPLKILTKHKNSLPEIEALVFGQSGILELNEFDDSYKQKLNRDFQHLKIKYGLESIDGHIWKFLRLRPGNFPTIRLAQFASLIFNSSNLLSKVIETGDIEELYRLFETEPSEFWKNRYHFGKAGKVKAKSMGKESAKSIVINAIAPFLYIYGEKTGKSILQDKALGLLQDISPEKNSITKKWAELGIKAKNSFESQALIHLKKEYCTLKKCLLCKIGHLVITKS